MTLGVLDETLNLFDRLLTERESTARAQMVDELAERARRTEQRQRLLDELLVLILDSESTTMRVRRQHTLRFPTRWPWRTQFTTMLDNLRALPGPAG